MFLTKHFLRNFNYSKVRMVCALVIVSIFNQQMLDSKDKTVSLK